MLTEDLAAAKTELVSSKKEFTECQAKLAKLLEEYTTLKYKNKRMADNADNKIKRLQTFLTEANDKLGTYQPSVSSQPFIFDDTPRPMKHLFSSIE